MFNIPANKRSRVISSLVQAIWFTITSVISWPLSLWAAAHTRWLSQGGTFFDVWTGAFSIIVGIVAICCTAGTIVTWGSVTETLAE